MCYNYQNSLYLPSKYSQGRWKLGICALTIKRKTYNFAQLFMSFTIIRRYSCEQQANHPPRPNNTNAVQNQLLFFFFQIIQAIIITADIYIQTFLRSIKPMEIKHNKLCIISYIILNKKFITQISLKNQCLTSSKSLIKQTEKSISQEKDGRIF